MERRHWITLAVLAVLAVVWFVSAEIRSAKAYDALGDWPHAPRIPLDRASLAASSDGLVTTVSNCLSGEYRIVQSRTYPNRPIINGVAVKAGVREQLTKDFRYPEHNIFVRERVPEPSCDDAYIIVWRLGLIARHYVAVAHPLADADVVGYFELEPT